MIDQLLYVRRITDHLIGGGEIGVSFVPERCGQVLARGEQIGKNFVVCRVGAALVGPVHAQAERGIAGEAVHRPEIGLIRCQGVGAVGVRLVARYVVVGQTGKFIARRRYAAVCRRRHCDRR